MYIVKNNKEENNLEHSLDNAINCLNQYQENLNQKAYKILSQGDPKMQLENIDQQYLLASAVKIKENNNCWKKIIKTKETHNFYTYIDGQLYENLEPIFNNNFNKTITDNILYQTMNNKKKLTYKEFKESIITNSFGYTEIEDFNPKYFVKIPQEVLEEHIKTLKMLNKLLEDKTYLDNMIDSLNNINNKLNLLYEDLEILNRTDELEEIDKEGLLLQELAKSTIIEN